MEDSDSLRLVESWYWDLDLMLPKSVPAILTGVALPGGVESDLFGLTFKDILADRTFNPNPLPWNTHG